MRQPSLLEKGINVPDKVSTSLKASYNSQLSCINKVIGSIQNFFKKVRSYVNIRAPCLLCALWRFATNV